MSESTPSAAQLQLYHSAISVIQEFEEAYGQTHAPQSPDAAEDSGDSQSYENQEASPGNGDSGQRKARSQEEKALDGLWVSIPQRFVFHIKEDMILGFETRRDGSIRIVNEEREPCLSEGNDAVELEIEVFSGDTCYVKNSSVKFTKHVKRR